MCIRDRTQAKTILDLASKVEPEFLAKLAVYARQRGYLKDVPALLAAYLAAHSLPYFGAAFPHVIDNGKQIRNFAQIIRSGAVGRRSFGSSVRNTIRAWFNTRTPDQIFWNSIGSDPTIGDVLKMVHPKPPTPEHSALYSYLIGKGAISENLLPDGLRDYNVYKQGEVTEFPRVPFEMLAGILLTAEQWAQLAKQMTWSQTRQSLNALARHGAFDQPGVTAMVADRLRDPELIAKAKVYPYQLLAAYTAIGDKVTPEIGLALQDAMEIALVNIPAYHGKVVVCPDVSGSMHTPVTGIRGSATSKVNCNQVAGLICAAIVRKNPLADVIAFTTEATRVRLNPRDTVITNTEKIAVLPPGGTAISAPLALLNKEQAAPDLVIIVSDNQSWADFSLSRSLWRTPATETMEQWALLRTRNPNAKLVLIDLQPDATSQVVDREDVLNVGGWSDAAFDVIGQFLSGELTGDHWASLIRSVAL